MMAECSCSLHCGVASAVCGGDYHLFGLWQHRGSVGPVLISSTIACFRYFATVFGLVPGARLNFECEVRDPCIAALTA